MYTSKPPPPPRGGLANAVRMNNPRAVFTPAAIRERELHAKMVENWRKSNPKTVTDMEIEEGGLVDYFKNLPEPILQSKLAAQPTAVFQPMPVLQPTPRSAQLPATVQPKPILQPTAPVFHPGNSNTTRAVPVLHSDLQGLEIRAESSTKKPTAAQNNGVPENEESKTAAIPPTLSKSLLVTNVKNLDQAFLIFDWEDSPNIASTVKHGDGYQVVFSTHEKAKAALDRQPQAHKDKALFCRFTNPLHVEWSSDQDWFQSHAATPLLTPRTENEGSHARKLPTADTGSSVNIDESRVLLVGEVQNDNEVKDVFTAEDQWHIIAIDAYGPNYLVVFTTHEQASAALRRYRRPSLADSNKPDVQWYTGHRFQTRATTSLQIPKPEILRTPRVLTSAMSPPDKNQFNTLIVAKAKNLYQVRGIFTIEEKSDIFEIVYKDPNFLVLFTTHDRASAAFDRLQARSRSPRLANEPSVDWLRGKHLYRSEADEEKDEEDVITAVADLIQADEEKETNDAIAAVEKQIQADEEEAQTQARARKIKEAQAAEQSRKDEEEHAMIMAKLEAERAAILLKTLKEGGVSPLRKESEKEVPKASNEDVEMERMVAEMDAEEKIREGKEEEYRLKKQAEKEEKARKETETPEPPPRNLKIESPTTPKLSLLPITTPNTSTETPTGPNLQLTRTTSTVSLTPTQASTSTVSGSTLRLLITINNQNRNRVKILRLSRIPDTSPPSDFLFSTLRIPVRERANYEILWVRKTTDFGREEIELDGEDAWEYLRECAEAEEGGMREVRIWVGRREREAEAED